MMLSKNTLGLEESKFFNFCKSSLILRLIAFIVSVGMDDIVCVTDPVCEGILLVSGTLCIVSVCCTEVLMPSLNIMRLLRLSVK